jgi:hypothetical protein
MKRTDIISHITSNWRNRIILLTVATTLTCIVILLFAHQRSGVSLLPTIIILSIIIFLSAWSMIKSLPSHQQTIRLLDLQFPELEHSSELLLREDKTPLESLQILKITARFENHRKINFPLPWSQVYIIVFITILSIGAFFLAKNHPKEQDLTNLEREWVVKDATSPTLTDSLYLTDLSVFISPPSYTGLKPTRSNTVDPSVPEGSRVLLEANYSIVPTSSILNISQGPINGFLNNGIWQHQIYLEQKTIYQLTANKDSLQYVSTYHLMDIIKDQPPTIEISDMPQYQRFEWDDNIAIDLQATITDDYGLQDAYIVATITQGSGESIRFREQKIAFDQKIQGNTVVLSHLIHGEHFEMEPGNEFYFHLEALDNKPTPQLTKSATYFFAINDTSEVEFSLAGNLGVDIMPDYFKSQLQLIIDTEQLIEERGSVKKADFNSRSNALGFDQKQLRLRYGQFMGEEDDSGLEVSEETEEADTEDHDHEGEVNVLEEFGHDHDHENESGQWMDRGTQPSEHDHGHDQTEGEEDPLEDFLHNHEDAETATFFTVSLKAKLRAALNEMWDAELYLRLFQPEQSLPYQYKALKLLKEIKNHARIYVQRVGLDPIEINEADARLSKEPKDFSDRQHSYAAEMPPRLDGIEQLIQEIEFYSLTKYEVIDQEIWQTAMEELALLSMEQPGNFLLELNAIGKLKAIQQPDSSYYSEVILLRERLISMLTPKNNQPKIRTYDSSPMDERFRVKLSEIQE